MSLIAGEILSVERTFTAEDVELFTKVSRDKTDHLSLDAKSRLVARGLLTATRTTKVGRHHNVLARTMNIDFSRPVFSTDTINCDLKILRSEKR